MIRTPHREWRSWRAYPQPRSDPEIVAVLIKLRDDAGLTQMEAAHAVGLEGTKSRDSFSAWESGMSIPRVARRPGFLIYLLDSLRLRRDPPASIRYGTMSWWANGVGRPSAIPSGQGFSQAGAEPDSDLLSLRRSGLSSLPVLPFRRMLISFVGRGSELDQLRATLESSHRLVLTGMPGAGKTWLAGVPGLSVLVTPT